MTLTPDPENQPVDPDTDQDDPERRDTGDAELLPGDPNAPDPGDGNGDDTDTTTG